MEDLDKFLEEQGFEKTPESPVTLSQLSDIVDRLETCRSMGQIKTISVQPGFFVPKAKPENYDSDLFQNSYVVYIEK